MRIPVVDTIKYESSIYYYINETNSLYKININDSVETLVGCVDGEDNYLPDKYETLILLNNKIYFIPYMAKELAIYNITNDSFEKKEIPKSDDKIMGYMAAIAIGEKIFLFGTSKPLITIINDETMEIITIESLEDRIKKYVFNQDDAYFRKQLAVYGEWIYAPLCNANAVVRINIIDYAVDIIILGDEKNGYSGADIKDGELWLCPRKLDGKITCLNLSDTKKIKVFDVPKVFKNKEGTFVGIEAGDTILLYSSSEVKGLTKVYEDIFIKKGCYGNLNVQGEVYTFFNRASNSIGVIEKASNTNIGIDITAPEFQEMYKHNISGYVISEGIAMLADFINWVKEL